MKTLKKIYLGLISCAFLLTSLITTTFAWFKLNSESIVSDFDLHVTQQEGIRISIDGQNYSDDLSIAKAKMAIVAKYMGYTITNDRLYNGVTQISSDDIDTLFSEISLKPVSSTDGITFNDEYLRSVDLSTGEYISFDLFLRYETDGEAPESGVPLYFVSDIVQYDNNNDGDFDDAVDFTVNPVSITSIDRNVVLVNSARSFKLLDTDIISPNDGYYEGGETVTINKANAARFSTEVGSGAQTIDKVYDINLYDGSNVVGFGSYATDSNLKPEYDADLNLAYTHSSAIRGNPNFYSTIDYNQLFGTNSMYYNAVDESVAAATVGLMERDSTNTHICNLKVTFKFWVEGSDADCIDMWGNAPITVNLGFGLDLPDSLG